MQEYQDAGAGNDDPELPDLFDVPLEDLSALDHLKSHVNDLAKNLKSDSNNEISSSPRNLLLPSGHSLHSEIERRSYNFVHYIYSQRFGSDERLRGGLDDKRLEYAKTDITRAWRSLEADVHRVVAVMKRGYDAIELEQGDMRRMESSQAVDVDERARSHEWINALRMEMARLSLHDWRTYIQTSRRG